MARLLDPATKHCWLGAGLRANPGRFVGAASFPLGRAGVHLRRRCPRLPNRRHVDPQSWRRTARPDQQIPRQRHPAFCDLFHPPLDVARWHGVCERAGVAVGRDSPGRYCRFVVWAVGDFMARNVSLRAFPVVVGGHGVDLCLLHPRYAVADRRAHRTSLPDLCRRPVDHGRRTRFRLVERRDRDAVVHAGQPTP